MTHENINDRAAIKVVLNIDHQVVVLDDVKRDSVEGNFKIYSDPEPFSTRTN